MFLKITLVISLVNICSCATPTYPEGKSNQAVYSHSFNREDVPLSYKYSAVHVYTPNHEKEPAQQNLKNLNKPGIQYAPLPAQYNEAGLYTQVTYTKDTTEASTSEGPTEYTGKIKHLEPKLETRNPIFKNLHSMFYNQYIPGHNIHVLQSSNRSPTAYNAHQITPQADSQTKSHYFEQFYEEPQKPPASTTHKPKVVEHFVLKTTESPKYAPYKFVPKPQQNPQINFHMKDMKLSLFGQGHGGQMYSAKVPQLQLNIGREHKFPTQQQRVGPPHLSPARFYAYPVNPSSHPFVDRTKKIPSDTIQLQPLPNHLHLSAYSRT